MNIRILFIFCTALLTIGSCLAEDSTFCKSSCASELRTCRASAQSNSRDPLLPPSGVWYRNPLAQTAAGEVPGQGSRALRSAGDTNRRMDKIDICEKSHQLCIRSCDSRTGTPGRVAAGH